MSVSRAIGCSPLVYNIIRRNLYWAICSSRYYCMVRLYIYVNLCATTFKLILHWESIRCRRTDSSETTDRNDEFIRRKNLLLFVHHSIDCKSSIVILRVHCRYRDDSFNSEWIKYKCERWGCTLSYSHIQD